MRIVFFGTPDFAAEILQDLIQKKAQIVAVVTQTDRPKGRGKKLISTPVKEIALHQNIPVYQPEKASQSEFIQRMKGYNADLFVIVAYGQILKQELLDGAKIDAINVHASLLPRYRGASPIQRSLMNGDPKTGITIMKVVLAMDAGDILLQLPVEISEDMILGELEKKLCEAGKEGLWEVIQQYQTSSIKKIPQGPDLVSYAPKLKSEERQIIWNHPAEKIHNLVRALSPKPGAWTWLEQGAEKKRMKVLRTKFSNNNLSSVEVKIEDGKVFVGASKGSVELLEVQPEGKKVLPVSDWVRGCKEKIKIN